MNRRRFLTAVPAVALAPLVAKLPAAPALEIPAEIPLEYFQAGELTHLMGSSLGWGVGSAIGGPIGHALKITRTDGTVLSFISEDE